MHSKRNLERSANQIVGQPAWHSPSPALCLSFHVETWEMMLIFELLCLEEERNVGALLMWDPPCLFLTHGIESFVAVVS